MGTTTAPACPDTADEQKTISTIKAQFALLGFELRQVNTGFVVSRWAMSKHFNDLAGVREFFAQVGGRL